MNWENEFKVSPRKIGLIIYEVPSTRDTNNNIIKETTDKKGNLEFEIRKYHYNESKPVNKRKKDIMVMKIRNHTQIYLNKKNCW
jgi:hypothetical protein